MTRLEKYPNPLSASIKGYILRFLKDNFNTLNIKLEIYFYIKYCIGNFYFIQWWN